MKAKEYTPDIFKSIYIINHFVSYKMQRSHCQFQSSQIKQKKRKIKQNNKTSKLVSLNCDRDI